MRTPVPIVASTRIINGKPHKFQSKPEGQIPAIHRSLKVSHLASGVNQNLWHHVDSRKHIGYNATLVLLLAVFRFWSDGLAAT